MSRRAFALLCLAVAAAFAAVLGLLLAIAPRSEEGIDWTGQLVEGGWMAWTLPVALFFLAIAALLALMTLLAVRYPEAPDDHITAHVLRSSSTRRRSALRRRARTDRMPAERPR